MPTVNNSNGNTSNSRRQRPVAEASQAAPAQAAPADTTSQESAPAGGSTSPAIWKAEQIHGAIIVFPREGSEESKGRLRPSLIVLADRGVNIPARWGRLQPGQQGAGARVLHGDADIMALLGKYDILVSPVGYSNGSSQGYVEELNKLAPGYLPASLSLQADIEALRAGGALPSKAALWAKLTPLITSEADRKSTAQAIWQYWLDRAASEAENGQDLF